MAIATKKMEFAAQGWTDWKDGMEQRALALRLPARDVEDVRFFLCELESRVGLRSSMGSQIERIAQRYGRDDTITEDPSTPVEMRRAKASTQGDALVEHLLETETPAEALERRARAALAELPDHVKRALAPEEPVKVRVKRPKSRFRRYNRVPEWLYGARVARGYQPETMAIKADGGGGNMRMVPDGEGGIMSALLDLEEWACPKNRKIAMRALTTFRTFVAMQDRGDGDLVSVIFAYYTGILPDAGHAPAHLRGDEENGGAGATASDWEFPSLGDLSPLATHIRSVIDHAGALTRKLRAAFVDASWEARGPFEAARCADRREEVSLRTAAHDLLDRRKGESLTAWENRTSPHKVKCSRLVVLASNAYLAAKRGGR